MAENYANLIGSKVLKIPLYYKFSALHKMISNDEVSIPGYIYDETTKSTFQSPKMCNDLLDFLLLCLESDAPNEKLKVVKLMKHLVLNGEIKFRQNLRKRDRLIKEATGYSGAPDPIRGISLFVSVRNEAQELLQILFGNFDDFDSEAMNQHQSFQHEKVFASGMGSHSRTGKYEGFGNAPVVSNKTVVNKVVDGISEMMDKILNAPDVDTEAIKSALEVNKGGYCAVQTPVALTTEVQAKHEVKSPSKVMLMPTAKRKSRVPGRAGGGWEDDDDDELECDQLIKSALEPIRRTVNETSILSEDSLEISEQHKAEMETADNFAEEQFARDIYLAAEPFTSWQELDNLCRRCLTLNCDKILELLCEKLTSGNVNAQLNILTFLEALLYQDMIQIEALYSAVYGHVKNLIEAENTPLQNKSKKLTLIFDNLLKLQS